MNAAVNAAAQAIRRALAASGTWVSRDALAKTLSFSTGRVDDELADLVVAGDVVFNERMRAYCLAGSPLARRALCKLLAGEGQRDVLMSPSADGTVMRMGVAVRQQHPDGTEHLVMADLEVPYEAADLQTRALMVRSFCNLDTALARSAERSAERAAP